MLTKTEKAEICVLIRQSLATLCLNILPKGRSYQIKGLLVLSSDEEDVTAVDINENVNPLFDPPSIKTSHCTSTRTRKKRKNAASSTSIAEDGETPYIVDQDDNNESDVEDEGGDIEDPSKPVSRTPPDHSYVPGWHTSHDNMSRSSTSQQNEDGEESMSVESYYSHMKVSGPESIKNEEADSPKKCGIIKHDTSSKLHVASVGALVAKVVNEPITYNKPNTLIGQQAVVCPLCDRIFSIGNLKSHILDHSEAVGLKCLFCVFYVGNADELGAHILHLHKDTTYFACDVCDMEYLGRETAAHHIVKYHKKEFDKLPKSQYLYRCLSLSDMDDVHQVVSSAAMKSNILKSYIEKQKSEDSDGDNDFPQGCLSNYISLISTDREFESDASSITSDATECQCTICSCGFSTKYEVWLHMLLFHAHSKLLKEHENSTGEQLMFESSDTIRTNQNEVGHDDVMNFQVHESYEQGALYNGDKEREGNSSTPCKVQLQVVGTSAKPLKIKEKGRRPKPGEIDRGPDFKLRGRQCDICAKVVSYSNYNNHIRTHTRDFQCECPLCGYKTQYEKHLMGHIARHLSLRRLRCNVCQAGINAKNDMKKHVRKFHNKAFTSTPFEELYSKVQLPDMSEIVAMAEELKNKGMQVEPLSNACKSNVPGPRVCPVCQKQLTLGEFGAHMRSHKSNFSIQCSLCGKGFADAYDFGKHMTSAHKRGSLKPKQHKCVICESKFTNFANMKKHLRYAHGAEPTKKDNT